MILCCFLPYNHESAIGVHMPPAPCCHRAPGLGFMSLTASSPGLCLTYGACVHATLSIHSTLFFPHCVHKSVLYICVSFAEKLLSTWIHVIDFYSAPTVDHPLYKVLSLKRSRETKLCFVQPPSKIKPTD